ncbi:MAG: MtrB/PioB family decaheme-associated outer membrane protein [Pseudomonadota bacterium]
MNTKLCRRSLLSAAICAGLTSAYGPLRAQEIDEVAALATPRSVFEIGIGDVSRNNSRFGQYTGQRKDGLYGIGELDFVRRDDVTGTWTRFTGRNLGLDSRELRFDYGRQGGWGLYVDYSQTPRYNPYTVNTALRGIGGNSLTVPYPAATSAKSDVQLKTERDALALGVHKILAGGWDIQLRFRTEDKDGARMFGRGTTGGAGAGGFEFLAEPIQFTTRQLEATLGFTGERLQLSGGYYGSFFTNGNTALVVNNQPGGPTALGTGAGAFTPIGLPPGNDSHQFNLAGGYSITPTTRATFKLSYARLTQNESFIVAPSTFVPQANLGGRIDTTQFQAGITSRPMPKLTLRADLRYLDRNDKTPVYPYFTFNPTTLLTPANSPTATNDGRNEPRSNTNLAGKLEASYALPRGFRLTGGLDYDVRRRNTSDVRVVSYRRETDETSYRVELRRAIAETATGALSYVNSRRTGSDWVTTTTLNGAAGSNLIHPLHLADRDRDKLRAVLDWSPVEPLSLHFTIEDAVDRYSGRALGPRRGNANLYSADASYAFSEAWQASAWWSRGDTRARQNDCVAASAAGVCPNTVASPLWEANLRNLSDAFGLGLKGKPSGALEIGADLQYSKERNEYRQTASVPPAIGTPLPDVHYDRTTLRLYGKYALQKNAGLRLLYVYDRFKTDDFTWTSWVYTDGTTVRQDPLQRVHFIGASYYYEFR